MYRMGKKLIVLFSIFTLLTVLSVAYVVVGTQAYTHYQQVTLANQRHCADQAPVHICINSPSALYSAFYPYYYATNAPLFIVEYSSTTSMTLSVSMSIVDVTSTETRSVPTSSEVQQFHFTPPLLNGALNTLTQEKPTLLRVLVTDINKRTIYYKNDIPLVLHSRWLMQWTKENRLRIAAWVTPNARPIDDLVTQATKYLKNQPQPAPSGLIGYTGASQRQVIDQVDAIYDTLRGYGMHYVNATVPYTGADTTSVATEYVKLPGEVLKQHSGMCIELTVVLASAVERIGLHTEIVIIPGHAFLGVATKADNSHFEYWDAVDMNTGVAGDSANVAADQLYASNAAQHTLVDTILISDARSADINQML